MSGPSDGSFLRPYAITGGRTDPGRADLGPETLVQAHDGVAPEVAFDAGDLLDLCIVPRSIAELSGLLGVPMAVVKVMVADLDAGGHVRLTTATRGGSTRPDRTHVERLLHGLRAG